MRRLTQILIAALIAILAAPAMAEYTQDQAEQGVHRARMFLEERVRKACGEDGACSARHNKSIEELRLQFLEIGAIADKYP